MTVDRDFKSFRKDILEIRNRTTAGLLLDYDEAVEEIRKHLKDRLQQEAEYDLQGTESIKVKKDKDYLRKIKAKYQEHIEDIVTINNIKVQGCEVGNFRVFIQEVVDSFVGFDILEDAFQNPDVSDIYIIDWQTIYIEEDGVNVKYHKAFRSPTHFKSFLFRLLNEAGRELNLGDSKKADFELFGDRYCATSPSISPKSFSLTVRKHKEDHITFQQIMDSNLMDREMAEFFRLVIKGERNLVYAGITGSGKTTTIRALLDHNVTALNKRMLVCEDTQELFPKNEHTLQLVSSLTGDPKTEVTLQQLVYTALRLKPKYIVIGEVRAEEAQAASEAMETGHSTIFTMHGGTAINCINRITTKYLTAMPSLGIEVVERIIGSAIDYIAVQDNIPDIGRRITEITEISYDYEKRTVHLTPIYKFDIATERFIRLNPISMEKADLMMRRGVKHNDIMPWLRKENEND